MQTQNVTSKIPIGDNTTSDGTCGKMQDTLILGWKEGRKDLELTFFFNKTDGTDTYKLRNVSLIGNIGKDGEWSIGHVNEYPSMHYFGIPRHTQSIIAYTILTKYFWKSQ